MADSLTLQITADTASLTAKLAQAQADVRAYAAEVRNLANQLREAGADGALEQQLERAAGQLARAQGAAASFRNELRGHKAEAASAGEAFRGLTDGVKELAAAFGVGFSIEKLVEGVKTIAELGEKTKNTAAAVGMTVEQFSLMSNAMKLVGGDADLASRSLQIVQSKLVEALNNPASKTREAFLAMGMSVEQMRAGLNDLPGTMEKMADAWVRMGPGAVRTDVFRDAVGRGMSQLAAYFDQGAAGIHKSQEEAKATGAVLDKEMAERLEGIAKQINTLGEAFTGLGVKIVDGLSGPLETSLAKVVELVEALQKIQSFGEGFRLVDPEDAKDWDKIVEDWHKFEGFWDNIQEKMGHGRPSGTLPPGAATAAIPIAAGVAGGEGTRNAEHDSGFSHPAPPPPSTTEIAGGKVDPAEEQKKLNADIKAVTDALKLEEAQLDLNITKAKGDEAQIEALYQQKIAAAKKAAEDEDAIRQRYAAGASARGNDELAQQYRTGGGDVRVKEAQLEKAALEEQQRYRQQQVAAEISGWEARRKILDEEEKAEIASVQRREKLGELTAAGAAAAEEQIVQQHQAEAEKILAKETELAQGQIKLTEEVANRKVELEQQTADKIAAIQEKADEERLKEAQKIDSEIASSLSSSIMQVLQGKETWGQAFQKIVQQQEQKFLDQAIKQLLDSSGIGEAIGGLEKGALGALPGGPSNKLDASSLKTAGDIDKLGQAAVNAAGKLSSASSSPGGAGTSAPAGPPTAGAGGAMLGPYATEADVAAAGAGGGGSAAGGKGGYSAAYIAGQAPKYGLSGEFANAVADIESSHGANLGNPAKSQYAGNLYQVGTQERAELGVSGQGTQEEQVDYGLKLLAQRRDELAAKLGRQPTDAEVYMAHQQGPTGAARIINADANTPATSVGTNINGNLPPGVPPNPTVGQWREGTAAWVARGEARYAGVTPETATAAAGAGALPEVPQAAAEMSAPLGGGAAPLAVDIQAVGGSTVASATSGALPTTSEGSTPYDQAVAADIGKNGPMAPGEQQGALLGPPAGAEVYLGESTLEPAAPDYAGAYAGLSAAERAQQATAAIPGPPGLFGQIGAGLDKLGPPPLNAGEPTSPEFAAYTQANKLGPAYAGLSDDQIRATLAASASAPLPPAPSANLIAGGAAGQAAGSANSDLTDLALGDQDFSGGESGADAAATQADTKATQDNTQALQANTAAQKSGGAGGAGGAGAGGGGLGSLLPLLAIGGAIAASGRRTAGTPGRSTPNTVFTSGGITTETRGSVSPALTPVNQQPSSLSTTLALAIGGIGLLSKLGGGGKGGGLFGGLFGSGGGNSGLGAGDQDFSGGLTGSGEQVWESTTGNIQDLTSAVGNLDPASQQATSGIGSFASSLASLAGGLFGGGGGGGGGGGIGGIFGLIGGIFALEKGGLVSAAGGMMVNDGKGGQLAILHPQEMVLPANLSRGVQDIISAGAFSPAMPARSVLGAGAAGGGIGPTPASAGDSVNVHIHAFDGHDVRRVLLNNHGAVAEAFARARRGNSRHQLAA